MKLFLFVNVSVVVNTGDPSLVSVCEVCHGGRERCSGPGVGETLGEEKEAEVTGCEGFSVSILSFLSHAKRHCAFVPQTHGGTRERSSVCCSGQSSGHHQPAETSSGEAAQ